MRAHVRMRSRKQKAASFCKPKMRRAGLVALLLLLASAGSLANYYQPSPYDSNYDGAQCHPPYGFRRKTCGEMELIRQEIVPACEYLWGPNACQFTDVARTNELEYRYTEHCSYTHYYQRQCSYYCQPTYECLDSEQIVERTYVQCCPGFSARVLSKQEQFDYITQYSHYTYYTPVSQEPLGCPVACGDDLFECLQLHGLTEFIDYLNKTSYIDLLQTKGSTVTVLAPTNEAFQQARELNLIPSPESLTINISMLIGNHLILENITHADLEKFGGKVYSNAEGFLLHRVSISYYDYSYFSNSGYGNQRNSIKTTIVPFINGAQVVNEDACKTDNGSLQIINMLLMPSNLTIAETLARDPSLSAFTSALDSIGLLSFLDSPNISRTLFAVTNDEFNAVLPTQLLDCLSVYGRRPLNDLLLYHISGEAHYNSSLAPQDFFYTLLLQYLRVDLINETVVLGPDRVPIVVPNIPARNGVIHIVQDVLVPPNINFDMCQQFVPTTEPPTEPTQPPTSEIPTEPLPSPSPSPTPSPIPTPFPDLPTGAPGQFNPFGPGP